MLLTVQEHPLRAQTQHGIISGGNPSQIPEGKSDACQMVEPDNLFAFSPVCCVKAMSQEKDEGDNCSSAMVWLCRVCASLSLGQGEGQDANLERAGHSRKMIKAGEQETSQRVRG